MASKKPKKKEEVFTDMYQIQKRYYPSEVGKVCPYCRKPYKEPGILVILPRGN